MSNYRSMPKLLDEPPISLYPSLAVAFGNVNLAIIFQQLHFLMNVAETAQNNYVHVDGRWWVYNSYTEWKDKYFQWLGVSTLKALFGVLEEKGLVLSRQGVKDKFDRRKWYTINYEAYEQFIQSMGQNLAHVHGTKSSSSESQQMSDDNKESETPYSETTQIDSPHTPRKRGDKGRASKADVYTTFGQLPIASTLYDLFSGGVVPAHNQLQAALMDYVKAAQELTTLGETVERVKRAYCNMQRFATEQGWSKGFGLSAFMKRYLEMVEKYPDTPAAPAKPIDLSEWTADSVWGWSAD